jgi:hypothetical protein
VALHICQHFKGAVQAGAQTGKAASNFNGPTTYAMFGWSHDEFRQVRVASGEQAKLDRLRIFYENTKVFVIDEINAVSAAQLGLMDEMMCKIFDPDRKQKLPDGTPKPFGGKTMVFMGDSAQLRPVDGVAIYDSGSTGKSDDSFGKSRSRYYCSQAKARAARGQQLYVKFLSPNCIWLKQGFRNRGLLEEIFDRVRNGEQTRDDLEKIMYQRRRFPQALTDCGIHYSNESCTLFNYQDLWRSCQQQQPPTRVYVSRAGYHTTGDNDLVMRSLATIPSSRYQFAPDVLCVAKGCEVRLIKNVNVAAGLVNSASGTVWKVIYNNADVPALMKGEHPSAYCIVVKFPGFRGFLKSPDTNERVYPLPDRHLVPLYRTKFFPDKVPAWIRKKQSPSTWYREQFPIDLSRHITTHRAQGQTWKESTTLRQPGLGKPGQPHATGCYLHHLRRVHENHRAQESVRATNLSEHLGPHRPIRSRQATTTSRGQTEARCRVVRRQHRVVSRVFARTRVRARLHQQRERMARHPQRQRAASITRIFRANAVDERRSQWRRRVAVGRHFRKAHRHRSRNSELGNGGRRQHNEFEAVRRRCRALRPAARGPQRQQVRRRRSGSNTANEDRSHEMDAIARAAGFAFAVSPRRPRHRPHRADFEKEPV